jgi:hypothetical protein
VAFVKCFLSIHESGDGQDSQNGKSSSILWPMHSMMLPVTVLRLCYANALAAAFLHSNDTASAPTMVGLLHILSISLSSVSKTLSCQPYILC